MSRENKFRVWDKLQLKWLPPPNVVLYGTGFLFWQSGYKTPTPLIWANHEVVFFTGLTDKNGKDVYDSDRVMVPAGVRNDDGTTDLVEMTVYWDEPLASFQLKTDDDDWFAMDEFEMEVIGNIFEAQEGTA